MKLTRLVGTFVAGTTLAVAGFGTAAQADTADDVQTVIDNIPAAVEALPPALQAILDTYEATGSLNEASFAAVTGSGGVVAALVQGTEQFGSVPLGYLLAVGAVQDFARPVLKAIDDPSTAGDILYPDDLPIILNNLPNAVDPLVDNVTVAVIEGLQGNLTAGTGSFGGTGTPALLGNAFQGAVAGLTELFNGTTYNTNYGNIPLYVGVIGLVGLVATASYVQDGEEALAPVFEALAPVTSPLVAALGG